MLRAVCIALMLFFGLLSSHLLHAQDMLDPVDIDSPVLKELVDAENSNLEKAENLTRAYRD